MRLKRDGRATFLSRLRGGELKLSKLILELAFLSRLRGGEQLQSLRE